jgi:ATP-dependent Lon protease
MGDLEDQVGAVTGLAWTEVGGELLTIEAVTASGKGQVRTTGKLGEVMTESVQAALSFVKARAPAYGIKPSLFARKDIHIHLPEGAVPKDGPSAGVGMVTAMISTLTGIAVRRDVAMTGEVTLRGRVLAIGGLKEKLLAALRGGIKTVLIPEENEKDLVGDSGEHHQRAQDHSCQHVDEVLAVALGQSGRADRMDRGRRTGGFAAGFAGHRSRNDDSSLSRTVSGRNERTFRRKIVVLGLFAPFFALTRHIETALVARHGADHESFNQP